MALDGVDEGTHGISAIPGSHLGGAMKGSQTEQGYIVEVEILLLNVLFASELVRY